MADILDWKSSHEIRYVEPITPLVVADVLERAAEAVLRVGWTRISLISETGEVCALGAIVVALGGVPTMYDDSWAFATRLQVEKTLIARVPAIAKYGSVPYWNDTANPGAERVALVYRALAAQLRKEIWHDDHR